MWDSCRDPRLNIIDQQKESNNKPALSNVPLPLTTTAIAAAAADGDVSNLATTTMSQRGRSMTLAACIRRGRGGQRQWRRSQQEQSTTAPGPAPPAAAAAHYCCGGNGGSNLSGRALFTSRCKGCWMMAVGGGSSWRRTTMSKAVDGNSG
jgi:hypothetical protein